MKTFARLISMAAVAALVATAALAAQQAPARRAAAPDRDLIPAPARRSGEGLGPFKTMVIRGAMLIDGTGAPPTGPVDIVIEGNRIASVLSAGTPQAQTLFDTHRLRVQAKAYGVQKIDAGPQAMSITFRPNPPIDAIRIIELVQKNRHIKLAGNDKLRIEKALPEPASRAQFVRDVLRSLGTPKVVEAA